MCERLERLASQPQRWGLTGEAEECLRLCVFLFDTMEGGIFFFWYRLCWRRCGSTVVAGLQLEEESLLRAAHLPDHRDDCLFCMTTADNERLDQEPTDCPRTSCIIYGLLLCLCFCFHTNPGPRLCRALLHQPTLGSRANLCSCLISVHLQRCRHGTVLTFTPLH